MPCLDGDDLAVIGDVMERYADLELGLMDASLVLLADRYATTRILTLDHRHFAALGDGAFSLLP